MLAGNTQGGQVGVKFIRDLSDFASEKLGEFISGLYKVKGTYLYVNRGIGVSERNIRFLCRPEVTVFVFKEKGRMSRVKLPERKNKSILGRIIRVIAHKLKIRKTIRDIYYRALKFAG